MLTTLVAEIATEDAGDRVVVHVLRQVARTWQSWNIQVIQTVDIFIFFLVLRVSQWNKNKLSKGAKHSTYTEMNIYI